MMIPLETLSHLTFMPFVDQVFTASIGKSVSELQLKSVQLLGHKHPDASRDPFSLTFRGATDLSLPQGIYQFYCEGLGEMEFFITQIAGGSRDSEFEAVFT